MYQYLLSVQDTKIVDALLVSARDVPYNRFLFGIGFEEWIGVVGLLLFMFLASHNLINASAAPVDINVRSSFCRNSRALTASVRYRYYKPNVRYISIKVL
jgi:hypothetical protein